jgi:ribosome biogenesis GTPase A
MQQEHGIQWYPGHIAKLERQLKDLLQPVDVVLELVDARAPLASRHPYLTDKFLSRKCHGLILNKVDVADPNQTQRWAKHLITEMPVTPFSSVTGSPRTVIDAALQLGQTIRDKNKAKGLKANKPLKLAIMGMPNVGKSSLINKLVGTVKAKTGHQAGVTRQPKWVQIHAEVILLDTPGLIPPKLRDAHQGLVLACLHGVGEDAFDNQTVAQFLLDTLHEHYAPALAQHYGPDLITIEAFALQKNLLLPQGLPDCERAALRLLTDYRQGRLGRLTLEWPPGKATAQPDEIAE